MPTLEKEIKSETEAKEAAPTGGECILFVDDDEIFLNAMQKMLVSLGYRTVAKRSSLEAVEFFRNDPEMFDLIITDLVMPHLNGYDMAKQCREIQPKVPVILCTGQKATVSEKEAKAAGVHEVVTKPFNRRKIGEAIRRVLDNKSA